MHYQGFSDFLVNPGHGSCRFGVADVLLRGLANDACRRPPCLRRCPPNSCAQCAHDPLRSRAVVHPETARPVPTIGGSLGRLRGGWRGSVGGRWRPRSSARLLCRAHFLASFGFRDRRQGWLGLQMLLLLPHFPLPPLAPSPLSHPPALSGGLRTLWPWIGAVLRIEGVGCHSHRWQREALACSVSLRPRPRHRSRGGCVLAMINVQTTAMGSISSPKSRPNSTPPTYPRDR